MSGQQALRDRAALLGDLRDIVQAMKNLAFAQLQRLQRAQPAQDAALAAMARALACLGPSPMPSADADEGTGRPGAPATWLVIGAERGFCGVFDARLAEAVAALRAEAPRARLVVAGRRLGDLLPDAASTAPSTPVGARAPEVVAGCASIEDVVPAVEGWLAALGVPAAGGGAADRGALWLLHAGPGGIVRRRLWPSPVLPDPPAGAGEPARGGGAGPAPLRHLPGPVLRDALEHQAMRLLLQAGLQDSLAQENRLRLTQMQLAADHLDRLGADLRRRRAALRQAEITNELETLVSALG